MTWLLIKQSIKAIQDGKVRSAGVSCYYIREINAFLPKVMIKPALVQNEIHPYYQDSNVVKHIQSLGIVMQGVVSAWRPWIYRSLIEP